jgi:hypothetical protein
VGKKIADFFGKQRQYFILQFVLLFAHTPAGLNRLAGIASIRFGSIKLVLLFKAA